MALPAGSRLGPYEILAPLGAGGMGEVYRAKDTRLDRTVAVKVLPEHVATNPEARQRFEREARAVSSLNHPHICVLHDIGQQDGVDFLVMEYLEGETLAARLAKGPLPVPQALRYGIEIADALAQAHRQGVFHRDLKPGNVMLTKSGAKLLDFGLAKRARTGSGAADEPTVSADLTGKGTLIGTVPYMAPEQLQGREADARTDIFAFGAVLYEMVTGGRPFTGETVANLMAAILEHEPPPLPESCPRALDRVVKRCLTKDPEERCQSAWDLKAELGWIAESATAQVTPAPVWTLRRLVPWLATALFAALAAILAVLHFRAPPPPERTVRFVVPPPEKGLVFDFPAISPDGERLAFLSDPGGGAGSRLWVRRLDAVTAEPLADAVERGLPFWSPDSRSIVFSAGGKLLKIDVGGGPPQTVCEAPTANLPGGAWSRNGVILFHAGFPGRAVLYRVAAAGGEATPATTLDAARQEIAHLWPQFLPDGRHFLYFVRSTRPENTGIYVGSLDSKERGRLLSTNNNAAYARSLSGTDHVLFMQGSTLMARPFDARQLILTGPGFPVAEPVYLPPGQLSGRTAFSVSGNGVLAYGTASGTTTELVWLDREGKRLGTVAEPAEYSNPALSPDEKRLVVCRMNLTARTRDLWLFDLAHGTSSRFTFDPANELNPVWSPDGRRIAFLSDRKGHAGSDIYQKAVSGAGEEEPLRESDARKELFSWSPGRFLLFREQGAFWALPLESDRKPMGPLPIGGFSERLIFT